jgi:alanine racemase
MVLAHWGIMDGHQEALIDLAAVAGNAAALRAHVGSAELMAVVKADGYGHGMIPAAQAAVAGGASWLGVLHIADALALRGAGIAARVVCLNGIPDAPHEDAIRADVDLTAPSVRLVRSIAGAAQRAGRPARVHLKVDTGMSRGGATRAEWPAVVDAARSAESAGQIQIAGIWSHLACADIPGHASVPAQIGAFTDALALAEAAGARPDVRHLANTPATLTLPGTWFDLVRTGGGVFGLATLPGGPPEWLRPAMTVRARLVQVKRVPDRTGVSYGHRHVTRGESRLGLVALGYAEGVPRSASGTAEVSLRGRRRRIAGTVCMDHFVLDVGADQIEEGDEVILFGPGDSGEPTAQEWGDALGTISYEIVTRFGGRLPRTYSGVAYGQESARDGAGRAPAGYAVP